MPEALLRRTVGEELAERLRRRILTGRIRPGDPLREAALAEEYGASRPSVRDALRRLGHEGLVEHETHRGTRVARLTDVEIEDILLVRMVVEPAVVRRFGLPPELRPSLDSAVERLESSAAADDWPAYAEADVLFHETLVEAARSPRLTETHRRAMRQLRLHLVSVDLDESEAGPDRPHVREHHRMAELLRADEREDAAALLTRHLEDAWMALVGRGG